MKQTIRINTFETNSSSTHSCVICSEDTFEKWKSGGLYVDDWNGKFYTKEQIIEEYKKEHPDKDINSAEFEADINEYISREGFKTYENWGEDYEVDVNYETVDGVKVVVACYYGYNG